MADTNAQGACECGVHGCSFTGRFTNDHVLSTFHAKIVESAESTGPFKDRIMAGLRHSIHLTYEMKVKCTCGECE